MSKAAIIVLDHEIISKREANLFRGAREIRTYGPFKVTLYWEPHYEDGRLMKSFTVDVDGLSPPVAAPRWRNRQRFERLAGADAYIVGELEELLVVEVGKLALRIN